MLKKELFIYETRNAPKGTFGIITAFEWKNFSSRYRGEEIISHSGEHLSFDRSSFDMIVSYDYLYSNNTAGGTQFETGNLLEAFDTEYFDSRPSISNELKGAQNALTVQYNLKNNYLTLTGSYEIRTCAIAMISSAVIDNPYLTTRFNVYGDYFHQKIGFGSAGVSVSINGVSVSVSPKAFYNKYQIMTSQPIQYTAN